MEASLAWLTDLLPSLRLGAAQTHENLTLVPIFGPETGPAATTLDQALAAGTAEITEVGEAGHVPTLLVDNHGAVPLLLFDGEELVGAKQNRVLNTTLLVAAGARVHVPVSCVEQGRWTWRSRRFGTEGRVLKQGMRSAKAARMSATLAAEPSRYDADQRTVWREVAAYAERRGTRSATGAMADVYETDRPAIEGFVQAFAVQPGQTGAAAFVDGRLVGVDLLGRASAYASLHPKIVRGLAAEAIDAGAAPAPIETSAVRRLLEALPTTHSFEAVPPGIGRDVRFRGDALHAAALVGDAGLVHLAVFPAGAC